MAGATCPKLARINHPNWCSELIIHLNMKLDLVQEGPFQLHVPVALRRGLRTPYLGILKKPKWWPVVRSPFWTCNIPSMWDFAPLTPLVFFQMWAIKTDKYYLLPPQRSVSRSGCPSVS